MVKIQSEDFSLGEEYHKLHIAGESGAIVTFVGRVRDFPGESRDFQLQHFPGMAEKVLQRIAESAHARWPLHRLNLIHRVGKLSIGEQIVFVGLSAAHRGQAFAACEYVIDLLKTQAPFWKKQAGVWLEASSSDSVAAERWFENRNHEQN